MSQMIDVLKYYTLNYLSSLNISSKIVTIPLVLYPTFSTIKKLTRSSFCFEEFFHPPSNMQCTLLATNSSQDKHFCISLKYTIVKPDFCRGKNYETETCYIIIKVCNLLISQKCMARLQQDSREFTVFIVVTICRNEVLGTQNQLFPFEETVRRRQFHYLTHLLIPTSNIQN